ncbi:DUF1788 domain-containing protein [Companilactobacillus kimchiensis]|uniref:Cytoplasmic protein n=1 Tax=Companilactobacillus kimchiensis TaxID=993692 RepID=A0A0R2LJQ4_9LACO|nr:DUF1788 domain-containing protein [Companilactobacillus kimchiensis]KRN99191.1 hypothetical protein IV57_GL000413 [Companilactobacillus kimchiensis]
MSSTETKLDHLKEKIQNSEFQNNQGLSNEVSYYILAYNPKDYLIVRKELNNIEHVYTKDTIGYEIKEFNVYQIMWRLLEERGIKDAVIEMEKRDGIDYLSEQINNVLRMTNSDNELVQYIEERINPDTIVFLTGIGQIYPLIRAHKILNTMHQIISNVPVVLFYPGKYDSLSLSMFGELKEDNYYRAFQIN